MSSNKFFTIMVVPEKSNRVSKVVIPGYVFKGGILSLAFLAVLATIMVLDYANVMNQINENKQLKVENRQLRQNVQVFKTKMVTMENTLDRVKTFVTKLRIITNIEDTSGAGGSGGSAGSAVAPPSQTLPQQSAPGTPSGILPGPTGSPANSSPAHGPANGKDQSLRMEADTEVVLAHSPTDIPVETPGAAPSEQKMPEPYESVRARRVNLLAALMNDDVSDAGYSLTDADTSLWVKTEFERLDAAYDEVNKFALAGEQETQDILERLGEKRAMLASTPTRIPTLGYITSEWGVRINPYDSRRKMHEGIDIANRYGADIIAPADGTISFAGVKPGYGKVVMIDHGNGIETLYAHSSKLYVSAGYKVRRGQKIAAVGNTGHSTGPHCHYEVHATGIPVDPCSYILDSACQQRTVAHPRAMVARPTEPGAVDPE